MPNLPSKSLRELNDKLDEELAYERSRVVFSEQDRERYLKDPVAFAKEVIGLNPSNDQEHLLKLISDLNERDVIIAGGRGSGKTFFSAVIALYSALLLPPKFEDQYLIAILGGSQFQSDKVYEYLQEFIIRSGLEHTIAKKTQHRMDFTNGAVVLVFKFSEKYARSRHPDLLILDEACCHPDTLVYTESGFREISGIKEGDLVLTDKGRMRKASKIFKLPYKGELLKIQSKHNQIPILLTPQHPILIFNGVHADDKFTWKKAGDVRVGDRVCFPRYNDNNRHPAKDPDIFRLYGYYLSEGSIGVDRRKSKPYYKIIFSLHKEEVDIIEDIRMLAGKLGRKINVCRNGDNGVNVSFTHTEFAKLLMLFFGKGASTKHVPWTMTKLKREYLFNIMRGMFLGDGSTTGSRLSYTTTSRNMASWLYLALCGLGYRPCLQRRPPSKGKIPLKDGRVINGRHERWDIWLSGKQVTRFKKHVLKTPCENELHDSSVGTTQCGKVIVPITKIEKIQYDGFVYNLHVDEDNTFVLPGMITHNSIADHEEGGAVLSAAMDSVSAAKHGRRILLSTPTYMTGMFGKYWRQAETLGFKRLRWSNEPGRRTWMNLDRQKTEFERARLTSTDFDAEWLALPHESTLYVHNPAHVDECSLVMDETFIETLKGKSDLRRIIGVDFGMSPAKTVLTAAFIDMGDLENGHPERIYIVEQIDMNKPTPDEVLAYSLGLAKKYGCTDMYGDSYGLIFLEYVNANSGIATHPVYFSKLKDSMVVQMDTLYKNHNVIVNASLETLIEQTKNMHRDMHGKIVKGDDDFYDSSICLTVPLIERVDTSMMWIENW